MLNKKPVFIVAFGRGGSNIILNMLRSHPDICSPNGETQEVFIGKHTAGFFEKNIRRIKYLPIAISERRNVFSPSSWTLRKTFSKFSQKRIDKILYYDRFKKDVPKTSTEFYSNEELANCRLLSKNLNGLIFTTRNFCEMYPDASFVSVVRDPRPVCEGHTRRKLYEWDEIARHCSAGMKQMIQDEKDLDNYLLFKYEDLVQDPQKYLRKIYEHCDLDISRIEKIRMETKAVVGQENAPKEKKLVWYDLDEFHKHILPTANENQMRRISTEHKEMIESICSEEMKHFGYL